MHHMKNLLQHMKNQLVKPLKIHTNICVKINSKLHQKIIMKHLREYQ